MLAKQLQHWAEKQPEKIALQIRDKEGSYSSITYQDLYANCLKLKSQLESMGYKPGGPDFDNNNNLALDQASIFFTEAEFGLK